MQPDAAKPQRMTLSQVVELLLTRQHAERSSVTLSRNAKGETQIEVVVRTSDETAPTVLDAERVAGEVYDRLRRQFPLASGYTTADASDDARRR